MRKYISFILTVALLLCLASPALASESYDDQIHAAITSIEEKYPDAVIKVTEKQTLAIYIPTENVSTASIAPYAMNASIYAPEGGTYREFTPPLIWTPDAGIPSFISFLPSDTAQILYEMKTTPGMFDEIYDYITTGSALASDLIAYINITFGIPITAVTAALLLTLTSVAFIDWLDVTIMESAMENGADGAISITRTTLYNVPSDVYMGWGGTYVSAAPFENWNPTFYRGEFPF